tara:strand:+ start:3471 stop:3659 length:189 start_codon:yes stop_codon:yes gene_type:complete
MQMDNDELQTKLKIAEEALLAEISSNAHQPAEMKKLRDKLIAAEERIEDLRLDLMDRDSRNY